MAYYGSDFLYRTSHDHVSSYMHIATIYTVTIFDALTAQLVVTQVLQNSVATIKYDFI